MDSWGIGQFIGDYPGMSLAPSRGGGIILRGEFLFSVLSEDGGEVRQSYELEISVPRGFPEELPRVTETGGRIPRDVDYHVFTDGSLCLGSSLRLLKVMRSRPDLVGWAGNCLVPYLHAMSHKLAPGGSFPFGELAHGKQGIIDDYVELLGLKERGQVVRTLELLGMKRRTANKAACPCGCGRRLGRCSFNKGLDNVRCLASRSWFRGHAAYLKG
jgi:hypothetical protein